MRDSNGSATRPRKRARRTNAIALRSRHASPVRLPRRTRRPRFAFTIRREWGTRKPVQCRCGPATVTGIQDFAHTATDHGSDREGERKPGARRRPPLAPRLILGGGCSGMRAASARDRFFASLDFSGRRFLFRLTRLVNRRGRRGAPRFTAHAFLCVLGVLCGSSCSPDRSRDSTTTGATQSIVDDFGDTIRVDRRPERIVSLTPATTEILFALGAGDRLVGRGEYDKWPDAALAVPNLGPGLRPNVEAVIAAKPDLVLLYASQDNRAAAERLRAAGIMTAAFKVDSIEQFDRTTRLLGRLIGDSARGALVADTVMRTLDSVRALTRSLRRVSVVLPVYDEPLLVIGGGSFMSQLVTIAGGRNIYDSLPQPSPAVTFEDIVRLNPDAVLIGPERAASMRRQAKWRALPAVRAGRI